MTKSNKQTCVRCAYYECGRCHRYPPTWEIKNEVAWQLRDFAIASPPVHKEHWCGEFKEEIEEL